MKFIWIALLSLPCFGQKLYVYSEFTRIDPFGAIVAVDRGAPPRHILSPGIPRNAFSSFRIVVQIDKPSEFHLDIAQNPENTFQVTLYKERFEQHGTSSLPDKLERVSIPYIGKASDFGIPGQKVVTFWLDVWTDRAAPVDRIKLEPQLWLSTIDDWIIYPMEVRVLEPIAPEVKAFAAALPPITSRSDTAVFGPLREFLCGRKESPGVSENTARALIRRNVRQHLAMTKPPTLKALLAKQAGVPDLCTAETATGGTGPEWYLKLRDSLLRSMAPE